MKKKKIRRIVIAVLVIAACAAGIRNVRFQSVASHEQERQKLAAELALSADEEEMADMADAAVQQDEKKADAKKKKKKAKETDEEKEKEEDKNAALAAQESENQADVTTDENVSVSAADGKTDAGDVLDNPGDTLSGGASANTGAATAGKKTANQSMASFSQQEDAAPQTGKTGSAADDEEEKLTCSIEIECTSLAEEKNSFPESLAAYIPDDGVILTRTQVSVKDGSSVYDVLYAVCTAENIAIDAEYTPLYQSYYVKGIGHLYEKQAGDYSGWIYEVNGTMAQVGASAYTVKDGDAISWRYTR